MSSCHCSEIDKLDSQITTLQGLIGDLAVVRENKMHIGTNRKDVKTNWPLAFICDTDATETLSALGRDAESAFSSVCNKIIAKKGELETKKSELELDDKEYHDEQTAKLANAYATGNSNGAICGIAQH